LLGNNDIQDEGATSILKSLLKNITLTDLDLDNNSIGDQLLQAIETEINTNKDPLELQKKRTQLLLWKPFKSLLMVRLKPSQLNIKLII